MTSYLYAENVSPRDRFTQLELRLDNGSEAIIYRGRSYNLSPTEVARVTPFVVLTPTASADSVPVVIVELPVVGTPEEGDVPVWHNAYGAFVAEPQSGGGGGGSETLRYEQSTAALSTSRPHRVNGTVDYVRAWVIVDTAVTADVDLVAVKVNNATVQTLSLLNGETTALVVVDVSCVDGDVITITRLSTQGGGIVVELEGDQAAIDGGSGTVVDASTTVKGVVQLAGDLAGTAASPTVPGLASKADSSALSAHLSDATDAHAASAIGFTPSGSISSTTVQAAIAEVASESGVSVPDASTSMKGVVQLAGDLAGTSASPQIAAGAIVDADVNAAAAIGESKLSLASDAAAGTASRRTLGTGSTQAAAGNHTHTGLSVQAAGTASVRALGTAGTDATAGNDARLSDTRTPTDNTVSTAKLQDGAVTAVKVAADVATQAELDAHAADTTAIHGISDTAKLPGVNIFSTTWPARPTGFAIIFWIGGSATTDNPASSMQVGDVWYPHSA